MYITYEEYKEMGGKLDETTFKNYSYDAYKKISAETFNRINADNPSDAVKRCMLRVVELLSTSDISTEKVSSFSHDGLAQTFEKVEMSEFEKKIRDTIVTYLLDETDGNGIYLLYRGVG